MRQRPLGSLQLRRLRELREISDNDVRERHLRRSGRISASLYDIQQPVDRQASRTVDAIVQERLQNRGGNVSTSARLRDKVATARRGVQTERSERLVDGDRGQEAEKTKTKTTRKIAAVRRRGGATSSAEERSDGHRRMGKQEAEWIERYMQYRARVTTLEKDCAAAWQSFFAGAGASTSGFVSTAEVNKLIEEMETLRQQDVHKIRHQLEKLSSKANDVQEKVEEIENGDQFLSELQDRIDAMEAALAKFRLLQRKMFEEYVLEEKVLEKELAVFMEKMETWENERQPRLSRGGASNSSLGPRSTHLTSNSRLNTRQASVSRIQSKSNNDKENGNQEEDRPVSTGTSDDLGMVNRVRRLNDAILRSGGLKGGWDNREHATFTTLLVKCGLSDDVLLHHLFPEDRETRTLHSNQESHREEQSKDNTQCDYETRVARFLRKCMRKIVTQAESSVRSHFDWYLGHLSLIEEKKRVIQEWKARKEEERQQIIQCGFEADGEALESLDREGTRETSRDSCSNRTTGKLKSREKTDHLLEQWKREKKQRKEEHEQRRRELHNKREAVEAKRKQEQLDAKQKVLLYKLHKEQEAMMLDRAAKLCQDGATEDGLQTGFIPFSSPTSKEDLVERSRIAIEYAKAKRLRLQQIEERKQKQQRLPPRPEAKIADGSANSSVKPVLVFNATEASKARDLGKDELRRKARQRERQSAHDAYIPGEKTITDVKFKSFGHVPIQPRAVPAWRKNI